MTSPLQGFDQAVAVTQDRINASLYARFQLVPELAHLNAAGEWGEIDAAMSPATVYLYTPHEPFKVRFCINLSSGNCKWYSLDTKTSPPKTIAHTADIKDWTLAFTVDLNLHAISQIPDHIKKKITFPGSYTLSQLLFDFTTANLSTFDSKLSKTPGVEGANPERDVAFKHFIEVYLKTLAKHEHNILGYAITVPDPAKNNPYAPSFPPISVQFQTMDHRDANGKAGTPGLNCLLFLEMTSKERKAPQVISWTQNWVEQGKGGSMVISKDNFWDRFFVLRSTFLNRMALTVLNRLAYVLDHHSDDKETWDVPWQITDQEPSGSALTWTSTNAQSVSYDWCHKDPNHDLKLFYSSCRTVSSSTKVDVTLDTDNNVITAAVSTRVWRRSEYLINEGDLFNIVPLMRSDEIDATINWGYSFILNSVSDGTLAMAAKLVSTPKATVSIKDESSIGNLWAPSNDDLSQWAQKDIQRRLVNVNDQLNEITQALKMQPQFVFPGGGTFYMKDPKYNSYGDLTVSLTEYKEE